MTQRAKLLAKLLRLPPEMNYDEVATLLSIFSFYCERSRGSHHIFRHPSSRLLTVPKAGGQKVKRTYLKEVKKAIEDVTGRSIEELLEADDV